MTNTVLLLSSSFSMAVRVPARLVPLAPLPDVLTIDGLIENPLPQPRTALAGQVQDRHHVDRSRRRVSESQQSTRRTRTGSHNRETMSSTLVTKRSVAMLLIACLLLFVAQGCAEDSPSPSDGPTCVPQDNACDQMNTCCGPLVCWAFKCRMCLATGSACGADNGSLCCKGCDFSTFKCR